MRPFLCSLTVILLCSVATAADAHTGIHPVAGFISGFTHPFAGADHLLAMLGVGLWSVLIAPQRLWALPLSFVVLMTIGGVLGNADLPLFYNETGIAASVLLLGALLIAMIKLPPLHAVALVGLFALFHGYAHGQEMLSDTAYLDYAAGFVSATGLLHLIGIALGRLLWRTPLLYRGLGGVIGAWGAFLLVS